MTYLIIIIAKIIAMALMVEAVTEILTSSVLTDPIRKVWKKFTYPLDHPPSDTVVQKVKVWIDKLISCGYCTSVWVSGVVAMIYSNHMIYEAIGPFGSWFCLTFIIHRLSNWIHVAFELMKKGRVKTHDIEVLVKMENENGSSGKGSSEESAEIEP